MRDVLKGKSGYGCFHWLYSFVFVILTSPSKAAVCMSFLGIHPTLTQVPPKPHFEPAGEGLT